MLSRIRLIAVVVGICLFGVTSAASAENWLGVYDDEDCIVDINLDSIVKGDDDFVYYDFRIFDYLYGDENLYGMAVDCQKRIIYHDFLEIKKVHGSNWKSQGEEIVSGSVGASEADLVCSRAR